MQNGATDTDVIVVGGGAAGLAAARRIAEAGRRCLLIEARERLGGRIATVLDPALSLPVELGAEFVHGLPPISAHLIREARLPLYERDGASWMFEAGALRASGREQGDAFAVLGQLQGWLRGQPSGTDISFAEYLRQAAIPAATAQRACAYVEGFNAADAERIGIRGLTRQQRAEDAVQGDRIFYLAPGYAALPEHLAAAARRAGCDVRLGTPLHGIHWERGTVRCASQDSVFSARQIVITVPLGVLQSRGLRIEPLPPLLAQTLATMQMGQVMRLSLVFKEPFWRTTDASLGFLFAPETMIPVWWTQAPHREAVLTGWAGGARAYRRLRAAGALDDQESLRKTALQSLSTIFGVSPSELGAQLLGSYWHDWEHDPFAGGAYSYPAVGASASAALLAQPLADTVYLAGEHTDLSENCGTVEAALNSGLRAAAQLLSGSAIA